MRIVVIGGGGYVGSVLCPTLVDEGHHVTAYDTFWYGQHTLPDSIHKVQGDMRDLPKLRKALAGADAAIHLACISNDPSFDLNPELGKSINLDCFPDVCKVIREARVPRFIYASSSSVYGIHDGNVVEETECKPLTDYSKFKLACEKHLHHADMGSTVWTIIRPATVCGASPRQRLDLIVNILTANALELKRITIHGGNQVRPNIHIQDMCEAYLYVLKAPSSKISRKTFNVGATNHTVWELAQAVADTIKDPETIVVHQPVLDQRSYHINSNLIKEVLGFTPKLTVEDAIRDLRQAFPYWTKPLENSAYHNIKRMKELNL